MRHEPGAGNVQAAGNQQKEPVEAEGNLEEVAPDTVQYVVEPQDTVENDEDEFVRGKKF